MARGRKRQFEDNAARQRAYRERQATKLARSELNFVTQPNDLRITQKPVVAFCLGTPGSGGRASKTVCPQVVAAPEFQAGAVCVHSDATGLLVRVVAMLDNGRVMARVLQAGVTRLNAGHDYPFRADLLAEVSA